MSDVQLFVRRARKRLGAKSFRYFACGEYGEQNERPHYHACIFGEDFSADRVQIRSGPPLFRSSLLESLWPFGHSSVGDLTYESAAYTARYVMKKLTGRQGEEFYGGRKPPFVVMSLKPGLGAAWFEKYSADVFPADEIVHDGRRHRVPRYYDRRLSDAALDQVKRKREASALEHEADQTDRRLAVREEVVARRMRAFRRKL